MTPPPQRRLSTYGAVDLAALKRPAPAPGAGAPPGAAAPGSGVVVDVTEATFQTEVVDRSSVVPVVVDFWAEWCEPCKQLSPILERLAVADGGRWVLARIDIEANQRLAGAAGVQSIPMVIGVVAGQAVPLFNGALPEPEVRRFLDELLRVAEANGVAGRVAVASPDPAEGAVEPPPDPHADAAELLAAGDLDGAAAAYEALVRQAPADADAARGLALVGLARRVGGADPATALAAAGAAPDDVAAQCLAADVELAMGDADAAFARLVDLVRRTRDDDRDRARTHLVGLFAVVGASDPRVARARGALANALF